MCRIVKLVDKIYGRKRGGRKEELGREGLGGGGFL